MKYSHPDQSKGENAFGRSCASMRKRMHLTQRELGRLLEISEQAIQHWERGVYSPRLEHLKQFIALSLQRHAFTPGHEHEEAEHVWQAAQQRGDFASSWQQIQQAKHPAFSTPVVPSTRAPQEAAVPAAPPTSSRFDWGEALDVRTFYGREQELALLTRWIGQEHCRVVSVLGMGGIGKSALAVSVMYQLAAHFEVVIFRSLRDAPSCDVLLDDCLQVLSPRPLGIVPANLERRLSLLLEDLRQVRALVVLDNLEALLEEGEGKGRFRPGYLRGLYHDPRALYGCDRKQRSRAACAHPAARPPFFRRPRRPVGRHEKRRRSHLPIKRNAWRL